MPETNYRIEQQPATTRKIASVTESTSIESPNDERAGVDVGSKMLVSEHPALALIEVLANLKGNPRLIPDTYQLMKVNVADSVTVDSLIPNILASNWRENANETRSAGDSWLVAGGSALLAVPSAPSPESLNYLLNPLHADAKGITVEWSKWIAYDKRLFNL
jgi:RES domain-containing protein